jgi:ferredoxin
LGRDHDSVGRVDAALLDQAIPHDAEFYLCGPTEFMMELKAVLIARNVPKELIHVEAFGTSQGASSLQPGLDGAKVRFLDSDTDATWREEYSNILELAEAAGLSPMHSCRAGSCGSCEHTLVSGDVFHPSAPLFDVRPGNVLLCCSKPLSDVTIGSVSAQSDDQP